jgi:hypothetical protein
MTIEIVSMAVNKSIHDVHSFGLGEIVCSVVHRPAHERSNLEH